MSITQIQNPVILIKPSQSLSKYIKELASEDDMPINILNIRSKDKLNIEKCKCRLTDPVYLLKEDDYVFMNSLDFSSKEPTSTSSCDLNFAEDDQLLSLEDLRWLYKKIHDDNIDSDNKTYFHEIFEGSEIFLPKNAEIQRNPELQKRCEILKAQQQNRRYKAMTKNVDNVRQYHPEDSIAYQMKQINKHLIAVAQFIISVITGFVFGFLGVELLVGKLDFGFRLLLGIICGLIVALADLYFLAKKLNENITFEMKAEMMSKSSKIN